jgi:hypothetical protein
VIIVDDASTDGSADVARELAAADPRIRTILHGQNRGHVPSLNEGLDAARGDYLVLLSADDALTPGALARATSLLELNPQVSFAYGFPLAFEDGLPSARVQARSWTIWSGREWMQRCCRSGRNCIQSSEVVMRASVYRELGGYNTGLPHSGDLELWLRAASVGDVGHVDGTDQSFYRVHRGSMQRTTFADRRHDLASTFRSFESALTAPTAPTHAPELLGLARQAVALNSLAWARKAMESDTAADYGRLAEELWPGVRSTRAWRRYQRALSSQAGPSSGSRAIEDLRFRLRWKRWRWSGVW